MVDTWREVGEAVMIAENARRKWECVGLVGVVVARQKEQSGDDCVVADDASADNADHDVVDSLTNGIVKEFDRVVE